MKKNKSELIFILDQSSSMSNLRDETIDGYNNLITEQKKVDGECLVTLVLFSTEMEIVYPILDINKVPKLTKDVYRPHGYTALLDSVGKTINSIGERLKNTPENDRPEQVIIAITTDGEENSSREFTREKIKEMISLQENSYNWKFLFLGANIDTFAEGKSMGFNLNRTVDYDYSPLGQSVLYSCVSNFMEHSRSGRNMQKVDLQRNYSEALNDAKKTTDDADVVTNVVLPQN